MEPHRISEKHSIPVKSKYISTKKEEDEKEHIEMQCKMTPHISLYGEGEDVDPCIGEYQWYEDRLFG
jgi:hypothetical protein